MDVSEQKFGWNWTWDYILLRLKLETADAGNFKYFNMKFTKNFGVHFL